MKFKILNRDVVFAVYDKHGNFDLEETQNFLNKAVIAFDEASAHNLTLSPITSDEQRTIADILYQRLKTDGYYHF